MIVTTKIHGAQGMKPSDYGVPLTFPGASMRLTLLILTEMSQKLVNGLS